MVNPDGSHTITRDEMVAVAELAIEMAKERNGLPSAEEVEAFRAAARTVQKIVRWTFWSEYLGGGCLVGTILHERELARPTYGYTTDILEPFGGLPVTFEDALERLHPRAGSANQSMLVHVED